jgi:dephospho-CoA kinase
MIIAGLTGTIGTGKSTVARMFAEMGAFIIDFDVLAHEVVESDKPAWKGIVDSFGPDILNQDRTINRQKLAAVVFSNPDKLQKLNSIMHPEISREEERLVEERRKVDPDGLIIKDIPLLLELGQEIAHLLVQKIIVVYCSPDVQLTRLIARGMTEEDAKSRINNQIPVKEKMQFADFIINNDGPIEDTRKQAQNVYSQLMQGKQA